MSTYYEYECSRCHLVIITTSPNIPHRKACGLCLEDATQANLDKIMKSEGWREVSPNPNRKHEHSWDKKREYDVK